VIQSATSTTLHQNDTALRVEVAELPETGKVCVDIYCGGNRVSLILKSPGDGMILGKGVDAACYTLLRARMKAAAELANDFRPSLDPMLPQGVVICDHRR
jgi:hypothetical protein